MNLKFKTKLYAGLGFLAFLILLLWASGLVFINTLAENSSAIIRNNNRTVFYMENMEQALSELQTAVTTGNESSHDNLKSQLRSNLQLQQQNITEEGEQDLTQQLDQTITTYLGLYRQLKQPTGNSGQTAQSLSIQYGKAQDLLSDITQMNLDAINRKNETAQQTASRVILYMTIIGALSVVMAIGMLARYPGYIINPIRELIDRIKKIANQNYDQRLEFDTGDEYQELAEAFNTMATRLQEYESSNLAKLMNEKERIEAIINHMPEAVVGLNKEKNILFVNSKAGELIGASEDVLVGQYAPDLASETNLMGDLIRGLSDDSDAEHEENGKPNIIKVTSGDRTNYYSKETIPVLTSYRKQESQQQIGTIITLKNVTHFQEMDQAKTNFIAVVSHELKTPIASINMSLRLLEDERVGQLNPEQTDLIKSIRSDADRMKKTTRELLDLSRIETGNIRLNTQQANPLDLIEYAYETMIAQAQQKEISLEIACENNLPNVRADIQKTVWVLVNLISNAVRYTPEEGLIRLKAEKGRGLVTFSVIDTGEGIPPEYLDKIFQKYFQIQNDHNGTGSGLGLAIAKEFINAQGGEIGVNSTMEKGSTFYFSLPTVQSKNTINS